MVEHSGSYFPTLCLLLHEAQNLAGNAVTLGKY